MQCTYTCFEEGVQTAVSDNIQADQLFNTSHTQHQTALKATHNCYSGV